MAPPWRWFLAAVAAVALGLCAPGSIVSLTPAAGRMASVEAPASVSRGSQCAAVSCNRSSQAVPGAVPTVAVLGVLVVAATLLALRRSWRRTRLATFALPDGSPLHLLRPPQPALPA